MKIKKSITEIIKELENMLIIESEEERKELSDFLIKHTGNARAVQENEVKKEGYSCPLCGKTARINAVEVTRKN
jgi:hypothetical protein